MKGAHFTIERRHDNTVKVQILYPIHAPKHLCENKASHKPDQRAISLLTLQVKTRRLSEVALLRAKTLSPSVTPSLLRPQRAPVSCKYVGLWDQARLNRVSAVSHMYPLDLQVMASTARPENEA